jgi:hypothetical protein
MGTRGVSVVLTHRARGRRIWLGQGDEAPHRSRTRVSEPSIASGVGRPRWPDLPNWFLVADQDYMILPGTQPCMAQGMQSTCTHRKSTASPS